MPAPSIDYRRAAILRASGLTYKEIASELGCNVLSLSGGLRRRGDSKIAAQVRKNLLATVTRAADAFTRKSATQREYLATALVNAGEVLASQPVTKAADLANTPDRQGRAAVLKSVVEASAQLFGWEKHGLTAIVEANALANCEAINVDQVAGAQAVNLEQQNQAKLLADLAPEQTPSESEGEPGASITGQAPEPTR